MKQELRKQAKQSLEAYVSAGFEAEPYSKGKRISFGIRHGRCNTHAEFDDIKSFRPFRILLYSDIKILKDAHDATLGK